MRVSRVARWALALGIGLVTAGAIAATPVSPAPAAYAETPTPLSSEMPGMDHNSTPPPAAKAPDRAAAIRRAKLTPIFLQAKMDGSQEVQVPGKPPVGDPKGSADGFVRVQGDRVTFAFSWKGISAPTLGHIHQGVRGTNGDVKVPLFTTAMPDTVTAAAGVVTLSDPTIAEALRANPDNFYLNLHTKEFPGGAVRGQLRKLQRPVDLLQLLQGGAEKAFLSGDQEVPTPGGPAVGDPIGRAVSFITAHNDRVDYSFAWLGIAPTLGHIHQAARGANGPVVVPLFTTPIPDTIMAVSGSVTGVDPALIRNIATNPAGFYTNLHTAQFPGGAVRGQLFSPGRKSGGDNGRTATPASTTAPPAASDSAALGNGSVILDTGKNFSEPDGSEGVGGPGCKNVTKPQTASSLQLTGGPIRLWSERDCKGTSVVVTKDVADLSTINFDKKIVSLEFGG
jgi:hypothetical protein